MKYIVLRQNFGSFAKEIPVIFPDVLVHSDVAETMKRLPELRSADVISAGFVSSLDCDVACHGESTTLKLKSRGEQDSKFIKMYDYCHRVT